MEFRFNVSDIFKEPIVEINSNLLPPGFCGDRRAMWDAITRTTEVVNSMGEASAKAQGLSKPITTAERLRNSEHQKVYLLVDRDAKNGKGIVTGMLKTGNKGLYIFDRDGHHYQCTPPCVLDFYVHETRQRSGLGKQLFEHMLQCEKIEPVKIAIDRPSDKFLGFLNKHYKLNSPIKQMNNFVVFDGFFPDSQNKEMNGENQSGSPGKLGGAASAKTIANGLQNYSSPLGRYGAPRPPCSMGQIIHNQSPTVTQVQESASSPGRLNQNPSYCSPPVPRQAYSSYETNVNSGVPNNNNNNSEIQMTDYNKQMLYSYGDVQKRENGGFLAQNYPYGLPQQQQQQQFYNVQTPNLQQAYYQPSVYGLHSTLPHQMLQTPPNIISSPQDLPTEFVQHQLPLNYLQANSHYVQQQIPQQQVSAPYQQQQQQTVNNSRMLPTQLRPVAYQQQMQPQVAASAPHLHTPQQVAVEQHAQQTPTMSPQTHVAYSHLQPQIAASAPQLTSQQQQQIPNSQQQIPNNQQQIPNNQQQFYQSPPQPAVNVASLPSMQPVPVTYHHQSPPHPPTTTQINPQNVQPVSPQEFIAQNQHAQMPPLGVEATNDHMMQNTQSAALQTQQNTHMVPPYAVQIPSQQMFTTLVQNNNTGGVYAAAQAGDAAQSGAIEQAQKYDYYNSASNDARLYAAANVETEGVAKKPSASGDRNEVSEKESRYELEYPPRAPETEPEKSQDEQAHHPSPKLERPRSLSIQISVDETTEKKREDDDGTETVYGKVQEELDENAEEKKDAIKEVEIKMENLDVKVVERAPDTDDGASVGRKTPHLTDQGFFDLKFYHNKLW